MIETAAIRTGEAPAMNPKSAAMSPAVEAAFAAVLLALLAVVLLAGHARRRGGRRYPPVAGTVLLELSNLHRLVDLHTELSLRHRTYRMLTPTCNYVYTVDPANVEHILKTNFPNFGKGKLLHELLSDLLGDGIFAVDGEKWRQQRKMASFEFTAKVLRDYSSVVFRSTAVKLVGIVAHAAAANRKIDIQSLLMKSTMDSIFKVGFGVELDTLSGANAQGVAFSRAMDAASCRILERFVDVFWKVKKLLNVGAERSMESNIKIIDKFVYGIIGDQKSRRQASRSSPDSQTKKGDILSRFLEEQERDPGAIDDKYIRDIILNFIIAGRDTTAGTLAWFVYMMCKHPDIQEKVAAEVADTTATTVDMSAEKFAALLTEEALQRMNYLLAVLNETLRLYPAVPIDCKHCYADDTLPDGFAVKKGDLVNFLPYSMGRMQFLWGADAEEFRPDRWLDAGGAVVTESPFKFTAFQAGPRICLGREFAYRQMKILAAALLFSYRFELWDPKQPVNYRSMVTLQIDGELNVRAIPRRN